MDPSVKYFIFCLFRYSWGQTNTFWRNFDWDPKSNFLPLLQQCAGDVGLGRKEAPLTQQKWLPSCLIMVLTNLWKAGTLHSLRAPRREAWTPCYAKSCPRASWSVCHGRLQWCRRWPMTCGIASRWSTTQETSWLLSLKSTNWLRLSEFCCSLIS